MLEKSKRAFKQFISSRWCPLAVAGVALLAVLVIAFLLGFRITYAPEIENSWDAVSCMAAWIGVVVSIISVVASFMAVWYAVRVADKQNRIALFEKRYELYNIIMSCRVFARMLEMTTTRADIKVYFLTVFCDLPIVDKINNTPFIRMKYIYILDKLKQSDFLFGDNNIAEYAHALINALGDVINEAFTSSEVEVPNEKIQAIILLTDSERHRMTLYKIGKELNLS